MVIFTIQYILHQKVEMKRLLLVFGFIGAAASLSSKGLPVDAVEDHNDGQVKARTLWFRRPKPPSKTSSTTKITTVTGFAEKAVVFSCATPESELTIAAAPKVVHTMDDGSKSTVYFGYRQASSINKNPIIALFKNGQQLWCREDYETSGADGVSMGGMWNMEITTTTETSNGAGGWLAKLFGSSKSTSTTTTRTVSQPTLYAVFTVDGTQDTPDVDFRRFTGLGWLKSYGKGGGPKVTVILQVDAATGNAQRGTFVRAELDNGNANSLVVNNLSLDSCTTASSSSNNQTSLVVHATSYYLPLRADTTRFALADCAPDTDSPFDYTLTLSSDLTQAKAAACRLESPKC
jgi:hypothetical protein